MFRRNLLVCFLSCICGIAAGRQWAPEMVLESSALFYPVLGLVVFLLFWPLNCHKSWLRIICLSALCVVLGIIIYGRAGEKLLFYTEDGTSLNASSLEGQIVSGEGTVVRITQKDGVWTILIKEICLNRPQMLRTEGRLQLRYEPKMYEESGPLVIPGQKIAFQGRISGFSSASNPGAFDYRGYMESQGIAGQVQIVNECLKGKGPAPRGEYLLWNCSRFLRNRLNLIADEEDRGILICLLTGDKGELPQFYKDLYQDGGIVHLLTISGLHISLLGMGLYRILRKLLGGFVESAAGAFAITLLFCMMAGNGTSMVRALIGFTFYLVAQISGRTLDFLTSVSAAGLVLLIHSPLLLFQSGFLMTFSCMAGIGVLIPWGKRIFIREDGGNSVRKWKVHLLEALWLSLASLPVVLWYQGRVPLLGALVNMLTVPLMGMVLVSALLGVIFSLYSVPLGTFLMGGGHYILLWYRQVCLTAKKIPFFMAVTGRPKKFQILLWCILMACVLLAGRGFLMKWRRSLPYGFGLLLFPLSILLLTRPAAEEMTIRFLDVGQGDGIVIELPKKAGVICIDGGSSSEKQLARYVYEPYFSYEGITEIDCLLITHSDYDHYSGMLELMKNGFEVGTVLIPGQFAETELAKELACYAPVSLIQTGTRLQFGELVLEVLHPADTYPSVSANDASAVVYLTYGENRILFTGDMEAGAEDAVLRLLDGREADVLKVAHHGSKTSSSEIFLEAVNPKAAVISCGAGNSYGHPHKEVLDRLSELGISCFRTDRSGCVTLSCQKAVAKTELFVYTKP